MGTESRDFIFIDDLVNCIDLIIQKSPFNGETINVASGVETTIKNASEVFLQTINPSITVEFNREHKEGDPLNWHADIGRLKTLGFKPTVSIEEGLDKTAKWCLSQA